MTISGGTVPNSTTGKIEILATSNSYEYTSNYASVEATAIVNSGTMLASARQRPVRVHVFKRRLGHQRQNDRGKRS